MPPVSLLTCGTVLMLAVGVFALPADNYDSQEKRSYTGYKLLRTLPIAEPNKVETLLLSLDGKSGVHFWTYPRINETSDILASPRMLPHVQSLLSELDVNHDVLIHDVGEILESENPEQIQTDIAEGRQGGAKPRLNFQNYFRYNDIVSFCRFLSESSAQSGGPQVTIESVGRSTEGRDIILVKVSNGGAPKPAIWLDGGMHAREWISPATVMFIMNTLVTDKEKNRELLERFDFYIVPVINVDGYEFTHTGDRFWRKTRSRTSSYLGCKGVDPNRNWGYGWGGEGTSSDPCSDIYKGPRAFSEPETLAVSNAILARRNQIKMYLTFHSYSQLLLVPWGFSKQKPADYQELYSLALKGKAALEKTYGTRYRVGTAPDILYSAAGGSDDWAKGGAGIKYSYTFELRDTGRYGFALPANQIKPVGEETFNAVRALALGLNEALRQNVGSPPAGSAPTMPGKVPPTPPKRKPVKLPPLFPGFPSYPQHPPFADEADETNQDLPADYNYYDENKETGGVN